LDLPEIKCEFGDCKRNAKIRLVKKEDIRVFTSLDNYDKSIIEINKEMFVCIQHADYLQDQWEIKQWVAEKLPYDLLFGINHKWMEYADKNEIKYGAISDEKRFRWYEQKFCPHCGNKIEHEKRTYECNDGYDSPSRWIETYKVVHCKNCGFFDYNYLPERGEYSRTADNNGEYSDWSSPSYDPDNKQWKETLKKIKEQEENKIGQ